MKTVLIIEDDEMLRNGISFVFEKDGFAVLSSSTAEDGLSKYKKNQIDLITLDLGLPDGSGIDLCKAIRESSDVPIIMLTARDLEVDVVSGLMSGADDYITKPFSLSILRAKVETILRRTNANKVKHLILSGNYKLDSNLCRFYKNEEEIPVSATEFKLLNYLILNAGKVLTKETILSALWDNQGNFIDENTLMVNISRLRAKIEDNPRQPKTLKTVHGIGYIWVKE